MDATYYFEEFTARRIPIVTDTAIGSEIAKKYGFKTLRFEDFDFSVPQNTALLLITTYETHTKLRDLWEIGKATVAHLAMAKFDCSPETIDYGLSKLLSVRFADTLKTRSNAYADMLSAPRIEFESKGERIACQFSEEILMANNSDVMEAGWFYSVAEFFEASIVNLVKKESDFVSSFILDGVFPFDGIIFLCNNAELKEKFGASLHRFMERCSMGDNRLVFNKSIAETIIIGGVDVTDEFSRLFGKLERGLSAMEIAIGCVDYADPVDWSKNSLLNEGTDGVHIGIGMGLQMPHIDFISSKAKVIGKALNLESEERAQVSVA